MLKILGLQHRPAVPRKTPGTGVFLGWWVALSSMAMVVFSAGVAYYGFSAFVTPLAEDFGWKRATIAAAVSLRGVEAGLMAPVIGFFLDRFGSRKIVLFGVVTLGLGLIWFSRVTSLGGFYAAYIVIALGFSSCGGQVAITTVAKWFIKKRGKALGLVTAGAGFSGLLTPLLVWLIAHYGWRTTLLFEAIGIWAVGIPLCYLIRNRPEDYGLTPDGAPPVANGSRSPESNDNTTACQGEAVAPREARFTAKQALKTRTFWLLSLLFGLRDMGTGAVFVHLIPYLISIGFSPQLAGLAMTLTTMASLAGRFGFGWLGDVMDKRHAVAIAGSLTAIGMLIFATVSSSWQLVPFFLTFSLGYAGAISLRGAIQGDYFGRASFGAIQGLMMAGGILLGIVGPVFAGWIFDTRGSYRLAFALLALTCATTVPLALACRRPQPRPESVD